MAVNVSVTAVAAAVFIAPPSGTPHLVASNTGSAPVYLGQAGVTAANGMPLYPNCQVSLARCPVSVYAVSGYQTTATTTTTTAAASAAATTLDVTSGTGLTTNSYILVGSNTGSSEVVQITAGGGTTTLTTTALQYDHASGATVTLVTGQGSSLSLARGTT